MSFKEKLQQKTMETENTVKKYLPREDGYQKTVLEAMNYSFLAGGKRLRPLMMRESYRYFGGESAIVEPFMAALEMIHNYSLVHDDLPEMDNDELRRGMPTTHIKYGADMAVLAGDGLLNYAFETAFQAYEFAGDEEEKDRVMEALKVLGKKAGIYGMIGGQTLDVEAEKKHLSLDLESLLFIHENKTAALLQAALVIGGILAGASGEDIQTLDKIGYNVGIAFQIQDDILDVTSTTEELGKPVGSDERNQKVTYVSLMGLDKARQEQKQYCQEAITLLGTLHAVRDDGFLTDLVTSLITRTK